MKKSFLTTVVAGLLAITACNATTVNSEMKMNISNKEKAVALLNSIETGDQTAISYVNPVKYTQHNLAVGDGLAGFGAVLQALPKNSAKVNVARSFTDGEYVFTHNDYNFFGPKIGFDLFRFEDGLIVEHWDNLDDKSATPNPSGRSQIDGPTTVDDLDKTDENKTLVANFVDSILVKGQFDQLSAFFEGDFYHQHNTVIADGLSGLGQALEAMAKNGIKMVYTKNHKILGEGNFVLSISEGSFADKPTSFYDLFRVENGKIVEHWDVMETIIPKERWKNTNGKFGNL
ncbi:nuclear transport factor 2 family protein [Colwellia psychrerythraea]|uniref:Putative lipoprotein n=1 Tax=Colwellia psychrerythraea (strain 34H / ATCC BAA-681) TaxID=167879 RepID=Q47V72_COLP3|nr:nuclear transport factor 2 family protein [Colwellia psychrerythraea]AAZ27762.1 putative lipoprotein [Colwellia psychrerythraea 34H]